MILEMLNLFKKNYQVFIVFISSSILLFVIFVFMNIDCSNICFPLLTELFLSETCFLLGIDSISMLIPILIIFDFKDKNNVKEDKFFFIFFIEIVVTLNRYKTRLQSKNIFKSKLSYK